jgi:hypothetical protein
MNVGFQFDRYRCLHGFSSIGKVACLQTDTPFQKPPFVERNI